MKKTLLLLTGLLALSATAMAADATTDAATVTQFKPTGYARQYLRAYGNKHQGTFKGQKDTGKLYLYTNADATITKDIDVYYVSENTFADNENQNHKALYQRTDLNHKWGALGDSSVTATDTFKIISYEDSNYYSIKEAFNFKDLFGSSDLISVSNFALTPYVTYQDDRNGNRNDITGFLDLDTYYNLFTNMIPGSLGQELELTYSQSLKANHSNNIEFYSDTYYGLTYTTIGKTTLSGSNEIEVTIDTDTHTSDKTTVYTDDILTPLKATYQINPAASVYVAGSVCFAGDNDDTTSDKLPNKHTSQLRAEIGWRVNF